MAFQYYEREDVRYRVPEDAAWEMEVFRVRERAWVPYRGDIAKVLLDAERITTGKKYSDAQPRDDHGRWEGGGDFLSSPSDALGELVDGGTASIAQENVRALLEKAAKRDDHPDLTDLHVEGMDIFHGGGLGIAREDMPQVPSKHRDVFIEEMRSQGVTLKDQQVSALSLKPAQREISATTVGQMLKRFDDDKSRKDMAPIFVSKDNYVLDGHHRWAVMAALTIEHPNLKMPITRLMVNHERALDLMLNYSETHGIAAKPLGKANRPWLKYADDQPRDDQGRWTDGSNGSSDAEHTHYLRVGHILDNLISQHGVDWFSELEKLHSSGKLDDLLTAKGALSTADVVHLLRHGLQLLRDNGRELPTLDQLRWTKLPDATLRELLDGTKALKYSDDEPRDDHGRWTDGDGGELPKQTPARKKALWLYGSSWADDFNTSLRTGKDDFKKEIQALDELVHPISDTKLYRGMSVEHLKDLRPGSTIEDKGFVSTTRDEDIADRFGDTRVIIAVPKGSRGIDVQALHMADPIPPPGMTAPLRGFGGLTGAEQEVILPHGSKFEVTAINPDKDRVYVVLKK